MSFPQTKLKKQGRPAKDMAGRVRTLAWFRVVQRISGKSSLELGREFHPNDYVYDGEKLKTSHRWERYEAGTNFPIDDNSGNSLIDIVERKYEGTAYWYRHAVWIALGSNLRDISVINALLLTLDKSVVDICFVPQEARGRATLIRTPYDYGLPTKLSYLRSVDALAALIMLAREAEFLSNGRMHAQVRMRIHEILCYLKEIPEFVVVLEDVVDCFNARIQEYQYHLVDNITGPISPLSTTTIMGDNKGLSPNEAHTALEHQLLEQLVTLFGDGKLLQTWLHTHHPFLGEKPIDALSHVQGINAVQTLLKGETTIV